MLVHMVFLRFYGFVFNLGMKVLENRKKIFIAIVFQFKGYKVTDVNRVRRIGVACRSLHELKRKACAKLNVSISM